MKFTILVKSNPDLEARIDATSDAEMQSQMAEIERYNDELPSAGVLKDCDGLRLTREAMRVHLTAPRARSSTSRSRATWWPATGSGSCREWTKAVAWVKRCPNPMSAPSDIEIRPFWGNEPGPSLARVRRARRARRTGHSHHVASTASPNDVYAAVNTHAGACQNSSACSQCSTKLPS